jgi:hypothetical protein
MMMLGALLCGACGDARDWDEEIVLQLFKPRDVDSGSLLVRATQQTQQGQVTVNADGGFFRDCETNRVRIIPRQVGGAYPDVLVEVSSERGQLSLRETLSLPLSQPDRTLQRVLGQQQPLVPAGPCTPAGPPPRRATGEACGSKDQCTGGVCLLKIDDRSGTTEFSNGYCSRDCKDNKGACEAGKEQCKEFFNSLGAVQEAHCFKICSLPGDCRQADNYTCTPGGLCYPGS